MKRRNFLKTFLTGLATIPFYSTLLSKDSENINKEYFFDDLFIVHENNNKLIYPKKDSILYKKITENMSNRINSNVTTYLGVYDLSFPIKDKYTIDEFMSIKYYFESKKTSYSNSNLYDVIFRFIKDGEDKMHLDVFKSNF